MGIGVETIKKTSQNIASKTLDSHFAKRQGRYSETVVYVTVTTAGPVVYTQIETSYSYIPSYSIVQPSPTSNINGKTTNSNDSKQPLNVGAIVGGVVGGIAAIALIAIVFLLIQRKTNRKKETFSTNTVQNSNTSYYPEGYNYQRRNTEMSGNLLSVTGTVLTPTPRHLVAPLEFQSKPVLDSTQYHNGNGYYEDVFLPYSMPYYGTNDSLTTESQPSIAFHNSSNNTTHTNLLYDLSIRQVPNEVDQGTHANQNERHVPHLKDDTRVEPPHTKD